MVLCCVVMAMSASGCVLTENENGVPMVELKGSVEDAGGVARADAEAMSEREQFELFGSRYERLETILADMQRVVSEDEWTWLYKGIGPGEGLNSDVGALPGAGRGESYYLSVARAITLPDATRDREDLQPMIDYFEAQGWEYSLFEHPEFSSVNAVTDDNYRVGFQLRELQYNVLVDAGPFWGDRIKLSDSLDRVDWEKYDRLTSVPGVRIPFPAWDDPLVK